LKKELEYLLYDLCVDLGFCISQNDAERIASATTLEADEFACLVIEAEGMNPEYEKQWRRKIREKFIEKFGSEFQQ
jgi:hypothetical protein